MLYQFIFELCHVEKDEKEAGMGPFLKNILMEIIALETFFGGGDKELYNMGQTERILKLQFSLTDKQGSRLIWLANFFGATLVALTE